MINFSKVPNKLLLGKLLRLSLSIIPKNSILPILQGPNKNYKWIKGSGINGYWLGSYEMKNQKLITNYVREDMVCYDIGAHVGYYTLMFSRLSGENGKVFSFEPNPFNLSYLLKHLELNSIKNVKVFPCSIMEKADFIPLMLDSSKSHIEKDRKEKFQSPTFKIDELISQKYILPPDIVKIDVEGEELEVLKGMENVLKNKSILLFIALDNIKKRQEVFLFLQNLDYTIYNLEQKKIELSEIKQTNEIISNRVFAIK